jgi:hypothetical protein
MKKSNNCGFWIYLGVAVIAMFAVPFVLGMANGVYEGSSFVRYGDVAHMTVPEYQTGVVGYGAAASAGQPVSGFVILNPGTGTFMPSDETNLLNVPESLSVGVTAPDNYISLPKP